MPPKVLTQKVYREPKKVEKHWSTVLFLNRCAAAHLCAVNSFQVDRHIFFLYKNFTIIFVEKKEILHLFRCFQKTLDISVPPNFYCRVIRMVENHWSTFYWKLWYWYLTLFLSFISVTKSEFHARLNGFTKYFTKAVYGSNIQNEKTLLYLFIYFFAFLFFYLVQIKLKKWIIFTPHW